MLNPEVFVLYFHGRSDVDLDGKHTFQCATLFIQVDEIRRLIAKGCTYTDLRDAARKEGMQTMFETGIKKVEEGITSLDEVLGVTVG